MTTHQGHFKRWNSEKGYGFIARNNAEDVFVHISQLQTGVRPKPGLEVIFEVQQDHLGRWQGRQVRLPGMEVAPLEYKPRPRPNQTQPEPSTTANKPNGLAGLFKKLAALAALVIVILLAWKSVAPFYSFEQSASQPTQEIQVVGPHADNPQLQQTLRLIAQGGPFPYPHKDGTTFQNREGRLPKKTSGYYREYTVPTPGARDRGARRLVTGGQPPVVYHYTEDHYRSFVRLEVRP